MKADVKLARLHYSSMFECSENEGGGCEEADEFQLSRNSIRASEIGLVRMKQCDRLKHVRRQVYPITALQ